MTPPTVTERPIEQTADEEETSQFREFRFGNIHTKLVNRAARVRLKPDTTSQIRP